MSINSNTKRTLGVLALLLSLGMAKAQVVVPATYPLGNEAAKPQWIQDNPDDYRSMGGQLPEVGTPSRQVRGGSAMINPNPTPSNVGTEVATPMPWGDDGNKAAWILANPAAYAAMNGQSIDPAAPWGAPENKAAWKAAHPAEFEALNGGAVVPSRRGTGTLISR